MPEILILALNELDYAFIEAQQDNEFEKQFHDLL